MFAGIHTHSFERTAPGSQAGGRASGAGGGIDVRAEGVAGMQERRRRRRVPVQPMYTQAVMRVLSRREPPLEGHVMDLSETGMVIETDSLVPVGQAVTVEFTVAGLGTLRQDAWHSYAVAAEVVRHDHLDDFPAGPYHHALRFVRVSTMTQAQIARFIATQPG